MKGWRFGLMSLAAVAVVALMAGSAFAQPQGGGGRGNRGNRGGNFDPAQFRQRMMDRMKQDLGANDDEWKVLQPKVEKVMDAQRAARDSGRFGGFGGRGGRGGPGGGGPNANQPQSELAKASQELRTVLDDKNATAEQITQKLTALRQAREKAETELAAAQKDLKELLTARQEAILVRDGMLR